MLFLVLVLAVDVGGGDMLVACGRCCCCWYRLLMLVMVGVLKCWCLYLRMPLVDLLVSVAVPVCVCVSC